MSFKGKAFTSGMKQLVVNLVRHYEAKKPKNSEKVEKPISGQTPMRAASLALGIGEATVKRIMADYNKNGQDIVVSPPKARGKPEYRASVNLQPVIRQYIRANNFRGEHVEVERLREYLINNYQANIPSTTLWRALKRWGFVHGEGQRRSALKERDYVIIARRKYLRARRANRNPDGTLRRPEVYLDETYINKNHSNRFTWYLEEDGPWVNKPSGKGPRLIIINAITKDGWIEGAKLFFQAKKRTGDYHGQMDWENFSKWLINQLLPNIPANSVIIMDNAKYHNVLVDNAFPTSKTLKREMQEWLTKNDYPWTEDMLKPELYTLCKRFAPVSEYKLDQIAKSYGHTILRTPQYHPELQPIETCWAIVKNYMANYCDFTMDGLRQNLSTAFSKVTDSTCRELISKVIEQEDKYWKEDEKLDDLDKISSNGNVGWYDLIDEELDL